MKRDMRGSIKAMVPVLGIAFALMPAHAQAAFPGGNGKIAALGNSERIYHRLLTMNADGSGATIIGSSSRYYGKPAFSPDGTELAYIWGSRSKAALVVADTTGANETTVLTSADISANEQLDGLSLAWSPDGLHLVFGILSGSTGNTHLFTIATNGSGLVQLSPNDADDSAPAWSNDGTTIAFETFDPKGRAKLSLMDADGSNRRRLGIGGAKYKGFNPDWAPDDSAIVFERWDGEFNLFTVHPDGTSLTQLTNTGAHWERQPVFSPDGTTILYSRGTGPYSWYDLWTVPAVGGTATRLTHTQKRVEYEPDWQPT